MSRKGTARWRSETASKRGGGSPLALASSASGFLIRFFPRDGRFQRGDRAGHLFGKDDALGPRVLADDFQDAPAVGLEHDQVAGGLRFEFVEHAYMYSRLNG